MQNPVIIHALMHSHEHGTDWYPFVLPEGFELPLGSFFGNSEIDGTEHPELMALLAFLGVDYEPEKSESIGVAAYSDMIAKPTLRELQELTAKIKAEEVGCHA